MHEVYKGNTARTGTDGLYTEDSIINSNTIPVSEKEANFSYLPSIIGVGRSKLQKVEDV